MLLLTCNSDNDFFVKSILSNEDVYTYFNNKYVGRFSDRNISYMINYLLHDERFIFTYKINRTVLTSIIKDGDKSNFRNIYVDIDETENTVCLNGLNDASYYVVFDLGVWEHNVFIAVTYCSYNVNCSVIDNFYRGKLIDELLKDL